RDPVFTRSGHADNVVAELLRVGGGHGAHPSRRPVTASRIRCHLSVQQSLVMDPHEVLVSSHVGHCALVRRQKDTGFTKTSPDRRIPMPAPWVSVVTGTMDVCPAATQRRDS